MRVRLVRSGIRIAPFGQSPDEIPILTRPWGELRREILEGCGLSLEETPVEAPGEVLLLRDDVVFSREYLRIFLELARRDGRSVRAGLEDCLFQQQNSPLQQDVRTTEEGAAYLMCYLRDGSGSLEDELPILHVPPDELIHEVRFPPQYFGEEPVRFPLAARRIQHLQHWVHLQRADSAALSGMHLEEWRRRKARFVGALLRARSRNKWRILARLNRLGKGCDIHPTAVVEASVRGGGVKVGAGSLIRASVLGDGVQVGDGCQVELSSLGAGSVVHRGAKVAFSTLYPDVATAIELIQFCVVGPRAMLNTGALILDLNLEGEVRVRTETGFESCGARFMGAAVGPDAVLSPGVRVAPGRIVPAGAVVVQHPDNQLTRPPEEIPPGRPHVVRRGALEPLEDCP